MATDTEMLLAALRECATEPGSMAWRSRPAAERRLHAINAIVDGALERAGAGRRAGKPREAMKAIG